MRLGDLMRNPLPGDETWHEGQINEKHIRSAGRYLRSAVETDEQELVADYWAEWLWSQQYDREEGYSMEEIRTYLLTGHGLKPGKLGAQR